MPQRPERKIRIEDEQFNITPISLSKNIDLDESDLHIKPLEYDMVITKVDCYTNDLNEILENCTMKKNGLDMYYERLTHWNNAVQTSVIFFSAASTFIQSFSEEGSGISNYVPTITLSISSYSGFILAIAKYFKFDETKENVHNLRDRFSEVHSRIKYYRDLIKPWKNQSYYKNFNEEEKIKEWNTLINRIDTEYQNIIEIKKELFASYEKIIDTTVARKYDIEFLNREVKYIENKGKTQKKIIKLNTDYDIKTGDSRLGIRSERRGPPIYNDEQENTDEQESKSCFSCCNRNKDNKDKKDKKGDFDQESLNEDDEEEGEEY